MASNITLSNKRDTFSLSIEAINLLNVSDKDLISMHIQEEFVCIYKSFGSGCRLRKVSSSSCLCFNSTEYSKKIAELIPKILLDSKSVAIEIIEQEVELDGVFKSGYLLDLNFNY